MDRASNAVGTGREDALSRADDLAERTDSTRVIGQLTLDNARLTRERDALAADVARLRGHLNIHTYVECFACRGGVRHSYAVLVDRDGHTALCPECAAERIRELQAWGEQWCAELRTWRMTIQGGTMKSQEWGMAR